MAKHEGPVKAQNEVEADAVANTEASGDVSSESAPIAELSLEERVSNLEDETTENKKEIDRLTASVAKTKADVNAARNEVRAKMGLAPEETEEDPQSALSNKDRLKKLQDEQKNLEKQKEELVSQQEKEQLIRAEKEKILQSKLNELFEEFKGMNAGDLESIFTTGKTPEGRVFESRSLGSLEPEVALSLAKAFKEGMAVLPKILEVLPDLLKQFDEQLTEQATKNVEAELESEKQKMIEGQDAQKQKVLEDETQFSDEVKEEAVPDEDAVKDGALENPQ